MTGLTGHRACLLLIKGAFIYNNAIGGIMGAPGFEEGFLYLVLGYRENR